MTAVNIPAELVQVVLNLPESSYGANKVTFILRDGRQITNVILAWGYEIVKIGNKEISTEKDLNFNLNEIAKILSEV
jgi:hypothetical protein